MSNWYEPATAQDAPKSGAQLPSAIRFDFRGGKIQANMVKRVVGDLDSMRQNAEAGFSYWDGEEKTSVPVPKFELIILGTFWRVKTFTGQGASRITSSPVLDIKRDVMTIYRNGDKWKSGLYADLKEDFPTKETRAYRFLLCWSPRTGKLVTIQLSNTVENAVKRAFFNLENPEKPTQAKANLWNIDGNNERFYVLVYAGKLEMVDAEGADYKSAEGYIAPVFSITKVTPTGAPEVFEQAHEAKASYLGVLEERLAGKRGQPAQAEAPEVSEYQSAQSDDARFAEEQKQRDAARSLLESTIGLKEEPSFVPEDDDLPF